MTITYQAAIQRVLSLTDFERAPGAPSRRRYDLSRMRPFLERLGNPHLKVPAVHITGTKGKGSVAAMLSAVGAHAGYATGFYSSPHLHWFRERIRLNDEPVSEATFAGLVERLWPTLEAVARDDKVGEVTTFELLTAMAFEHFRDSQCRLQVLEVGLGGTLDATNVIQSPMVCIITPISLDHTQVLGDTVEAIARDKSGIIKPGAAVVCAPQAPEALAVIQAACRRQKARLVRVDVKYQWTLVDNDLSGQVALFTSADHEYRVRLPLLGKHQLVNAACAIAAAEELQERGFAFPPEKLQDGLARTDWPARLEVLQRSPLVVADGAHNPYAMKTVGESLDTYLPHHRRIMILGMTSGHDSEGIAAEVARLEPAIVVATRSRHPRSLSVDQIVSLVQGRVSQVETAPTVAEALTKARSLATKADLVLGTGSLFVAAELREAIKGIPPELYPDLDPTQPTTRKV
jgi:dihydrofolate synthase/folylpolyglutamate synthase